LVGEEGPHLIRDPDVEVPLRKGSAGNANRLLGNGGDWLRTEHVDPQHQRLRNHASGFALRNLPDHHLTSPAVSRVTKSPLQSIKSSLLAASYFAYCGRKAFRSGFS